MMIVNKIKIKIVQCTSNVNLFVYDIISDLKVFKVCHGEIGELFLSIWSLANIIYLYLIFLNNQFSRQL